MITMGSAKDDTLSGEPDRKMAQNVTSRDLTPRLARSEFGTPFLCFHYRIFFANE